MSSSTTQSTGIADYVAELNLTLTRGEKQKTECLDIIKQEKLTSF